MLSTGGHLGGIRDGDETSSEDHQHLETGTENELEKKQLVCRKVEQSEPGDPEAKWA